MCCEEKKKTVNTIKVTISNGNSVKIKLTGSYSPLHSTGYNLNLATRRMESVKNEFMKNNWFAEAANKNQIAINTNFIGEQQGLNQNLEDKNNKTASVNSLPAILAERLRLNFKVATFCSNLDYFFVPSPNFRC